MSYTLVTNFWNEVGNLAPFIENIAQQTLKPSHWFFIDDGSPNHAKSRREVVKAATAHDIRNWYFFVGPEKQEGDKTKIGLAWNKALPYIMALRADYLAVADVDTRFPPHYFKSLVDYLDVYDNVGAVSGSVAGEYRHQHMPMGSGKLVSWDVLESIDKFWNLVPDSFLNIKSMALGYDNHVLTTIVELRPTTPRTGEDLAYRLHYCGNSWLVALRKGVLGHFLRLRGVEQTTDPDARYYYSKRRIIKSVFTRRIW